MNPRTENSKFSIEIGRTDVNLVMSDHENVFVLLVY